MTTPFPFVAGAVLQASELNAITTLPINDQTDDYTLVVGDVGKRVVMNKATANDVTVDDSIFGVGDTIFIANKGAGATTITAGSGVTINSASGLELVTSQSGQLVALSASSFLFVASAGPAPTSGLELVSTTTIGTTVSSVTVTDAFSSTYDNYRITISGGVGSANLNLRMTLGATTANYYFINHLTTYATGADASQTGDNGAFWQVGGANTNTIYHNIDLMGPNLAKNTTFQGGFGGSNSLVQAASSMSGILNNSTAYTAFTLTTSTGTLTGGEIRVYGYANS